MQHHVPHKDQPTMLKTQSPMGSLTGNGGRSPLFRRRNNRSVPSMFRQVCPLSSSRKAPTGSAILRVTRHNVPPGCVPTRTRHSAISHPRTVHRSFVRPPPPSMPQSTPAPERPAPRTPGSLTARNTRFRAPVPKSIFVPAYPVPLSAALP